ncbi:MAG: antirestriction protein ArdA [Hyphomonadaceae bacterium]|nr:antirestriction protein ArdA [Hyphomonadaceae bacterium]
MSATPLTPAPLVGTTGSSLRDTPRIYVSCLAAYNAGRLHGRWIAADKGQDHIWAEVRQMVNESPEPGAEEWAIHDYDGFEGAPISEYAGFDWVCDLAEFINERGGLGAKVCEHYCGDLEQAKAAFEAYAGCYTSLADFAESLMRETGPKIPEAFQFYIDWSGMGQDLALNGDVFTIEMHFDEVHVFWCR